MNLFFIEKYIKRITKNDINNYANLQGISLTSDETETLYYYLKTKYKEFLTNPNYQQKLLTELKSQVSPKTAIKIDELYNQYKNKLQKY